MLSMHSAQIIKGGLKKIFQYKEMKETLVSSLRYYLQVAIFSFSHDQKTPKLNNYLFHTIYSP